MHALVIGTGSIGRRHIFNLRALVPDMRFSLLRRSTAMDDLATELGAEVVVELASAIAATPDLAIVASPSALHADALVPLLEAGIPCYVEKPVVVSAAQVEQVRAVPADRLPPTLVGCNLRFLPSLRRARDLIAAGELGQVVRATFQAGQWLPDWRPSQDHRQSYSAIPGLGGGVVLDLIHEFDAARWMLGEFDRVQAMAGHAEALQIGTEAFASALLRRGPSGPIVGVTVDYVSRRPIRRYEVVGDQATLVWDLQARTLQIGGPNGVAAIELPADAFDVGATYVTAMEEFLAAVVSRRTTSQDVLDGLRSVDLALAVKDAAAGPLERSIR